MKSTLIQCLNALWLAIVFIGGPAVSSLRLGALQLSSRPIWHMLVLGGLGIGLAANVLIHWKFAGPKKNRRVCLRWIWGYACFLAIFHAYSEHWIDFRWLKKLLLGLKGLLAWII